MNDDLTPDDPLHPSEEPPYVTPSTPPSTPPAQPPGPAAQTDPDDSWFAADPARGAAASARPRGVRTWVAAGVGAAVIAAAAIGGISVASSHAKSSASTLNQGVPGAASGYGAAGFAGRGGNVGTVVSVSGSALTIKAVSFGSSSSKQMTVKTSSSTTITEAVTGSVSDIKTGDHLVIQGTTSGTEVTATRVQDTGTSSTIGGFGGGAAPSGSGSSGPGASSGEPPTGEGPSAGFGGEGAPGFGGGNGGPPGMGSSGSSTGSVPVTGTVTAVDGSTVTVKSTSGTTYAVTVSSSGTVTVEKSISLSDLKSGETVMVTGSTRGDVITATAIRAGSSGFGPGGGFGGPRQAGGS